MPKFKVHLYYEYRLEFRDIEADSPAEAMDVARQLDINQAHTAEYAEGIPTAAIVDPMLPDGEADLENSENFVLADLVPRKEGDYQKEPLAL